MLTSCHLIVLYELHISILYYIYVCRCLESEKEQRSDKMGSLYIAECDGPGIVELLVKNVNELAGTGMKIHVYIWIYV